MPMVPLVSLQALKQYEAELAHTQSLPLAAQVSQTLADVGPVESVRPEVLLWHLSVRKLASIQGGLFFDAWVEVHQAVELGRGPILVETKVEQTQLVATSLSGFVGLPVDAFVSALASAFASHDCDGSLLEQVHKQGIVHPYTDGNDLKHIGNSRNAVQGTFDPYTLQCASIIVSSQRNEVSRDIVHPHVDTWQHASRATVAVVGDVKLVGDPILVFR